MQEKTPGENNFVRLTAPAKLTLSLKVLGRRPDGFHEIEAEMVSIDLADTMMLDPADKGLVVRAPKDVRITGLTVDDDNLINRALAAVGRTAAVVCDKRIPVAAGLGGGSSDAAAILRWAECRDASIASSLGADVPFCQVGGHATVTGVGDDVSPLPFEERYFVLLVPPFAVRTEVVYRMWDYLGRSTIDMTNELTTAALQVEPRLSIWRDLFANVTGTEPTLAGSGSTWFAEGRPEDLRVGGRESLRLGGDDAHLIAVRSVPSGWSAP